FQCCSQLRQIRTAMRGSRAFRSSHIFQEVIAIDHLHREEPLLLLRKKLIKSCQVWMDKISKSTKLFLKSVESPGIGAAQGFQRNNGTAFAIIGLVNDPKASRAQPFLN